MIKGPTLTGIVDYIKPNAEDGDSILAESSFLQVCSPVDVRLLSGLFGAFKQRKQFIVAVTPDHVSIPSTNGSTPKPSTSNYMPFVQTPN